MIREIAEAGGEDPRVINFLHLARSIVHGSANVEQDEYTRVGLTFVQLDVQPVASREDVPIDAPNLVARHVLAVGGKIDAKAQVG